MSETPGSTAGRCSICLRFMICCYPRQTGSDDERRPLLDPIGSSNLNSNSQSNEDENRSSRNSVSHDRHESLSEESEERHASSIQQLNLTCRECSVEIVCQESSSQTSSVKPINEEIQTSTVHNVNCDIQNSLVQQVNQQCQTWSVQLANQESQSCADLQKNPDSQPSSVQKVNCDTQNCSEQQQIKSFQTFLKEENIECQAASIIQEGKQNTSKDYLNQNEPGELAILHNSIFMRSLECKYNLLDILRQYGFLTGEVAAELQSHAYRTDRELNNALIDFINPMNVDIFKRGLAFSNQSHLENYINKNGIREPPDDDEWPVTDLDCGIIIKSYSELVEHLHTKSIMDKLFANGCLSPAHKAAIRGKENTMEQNRELLDIAMRRSVRHLKIFLECLQEDHAEILSQSEDKDFFAINLEDTCIYDLANTVGDIDKGKQEILRQAKERGFDARMTEDRLYFVTKTKVDEGMTAESSGSDFQSESVAVGMKKLVNEVIGNDVEITQIVNFEKHPVLNYEVSGSSIHIDLKCPLCMKDYTDPRTLECFHTFCLKCLQDHCSKSAGSSASCPKCSKTIRISYKGLESLKFHPLVRQKLDEKKRKKSHQKGTTASASSVAYTTPETNVFRERLGAGKVAGLKSSAKVNIPVNIACIAGVTVVDDEIFVIRVRQSQVNVYDSHRLTASREINIPDMTSPEGLAGCSYNKTLYISDYTLMCIHRLDLTNNSVTHWKMSENHWPLGLSVTNEHNVLVTVWADNDGKKDLVREYTTEGQLVRDIRLKIYRVNNNGSIYNYAQTIQLSSDQFVVCYVLGTLHIVCLMNTKGEKITSYDGGREGSLRFPTSMTVDYNRNHVFVADEGNNRILLLDADLTYLGQICTPPDLRLPHRLYFDSSTDRLIVGESIGGRVLVIRTH